MQKLLVIDTNILVNAFKSANPKSKARQLLRQIINGKYKMCISTDIIEEYEDVLHRPVLGLNPVDVDLFLSWVRLNSFWIEPKPSTPPSVEMGDEDDRAFFDVAVCLDVPLITRNFSDYPVHELIFPIEDFHIEE